MQIEMSLITVGERFRKDLGDIESLAASIKTHGLLHPIVITRDELAPELVVGARRLAACKLLGWTFIKATYYQTTDDAKSLVPAIAAENIDRKDYTPSEIYHASRSLLAEEEDAAKKRRESGKPAGGTAQIPQGRQKRKKAPLAKDRAAESVGTNRSQLQRIEKVVEAAKANPGKYGDIVKTMDETGNVAGAVRELKALERGERIKEQSRKVRAEKGKPQDHKLYFSDNLLMVPNNSVDLVCSDPPYNISTAGVIAFAYEDRKSMSNDFGEWDWTPEAEYIEQLDKWSAEFYRVLREGGTALAFTSEAYMSYFRAALIKAGFKFKNTLIWARPNPKPKPDKTSYVAACDFILFAVKGEAHTFNYTKHNEMLSYINMPSANGTERAAWGHSTQKPLELIKKLITVSSNPGDIVLDPFAGSGTTGEACQQTGRRFILIERDAACIEMIEARTGVKHEHTETF